jgi:hypothetical protein
MHHPQATATDGGGWRCRHGIHRWTVIPQTVRRAMATAGFGRPDWYIGRRVDPYCERCGIKRRRP